MEKDLLHILPDIMGTSVSRDLVVAPETGFVSGCSAAIQAVNATIGEIAGTDIPVLVHGDSGTGNDVYARLIYRLSAQSHRPLTKLSCTMLEPGQLLACVNRLLQSIPELTNDGSGALFLDGIDEMDLDCQRVLLSMLRDQESESGGQTGMRLISTATTSAISTTPTTTTTAFPMSLTSCSWTPTTAHRRRCRSISSGIPAIRFQPW